MLVLRLPNRKSKILLGNPGWAWAEEGQAIPNIVYFLALILQYNYSEKQPSQLVFAITSLRNLSTCFNPKVVLLFAMVSLHFTKFLLGFQEQAHSAHIELEEEAGCFAFKLSSIKGQGSEEAWIGSSRVGG
jgi:hypothetical protein